MDRGDRAPRTASQPGCVAEADRYVVVQHATAPAAVRAHAAAACPSRPGRNRTLSGVLHKSSGWSEDSGEYAPVIFARYSEAAAGIVASGSFAISAAFEKELALLDEGHLAGRARAELVRRSRHVPGASASGG